MCIQVGVTGFRGPEKFIDLCDNEEQLKKMTGRHLREKTVQEFKLSKGDDFRMIHKSETLEESSLLSSFGIKHMSTIQLVPKLPGGL